MFILLVTEVAEVDLVFIPMDDDLLGVDWSPHYRKTFCEGVDGLFLFDFLELDLI